ncbi:MAG: amidohydrolase family protein [Clostridiales bacterium]|nr:amidohydrolase family protein [Clostridiales bacterium]
MNRGFVLKGDICDSRAGGALNTVQDGYVVCVDGISQGVFHELPEAFTHLPLIDCSHHMIVPGLVDLHTHAPQYAYRALGMDLELLDWLNTYTFPEETRYGDLAYALAQYERIAQDLRRGPNTRCVLFGTVHLPATELLMELMEKTGLITLVGKVNMDRNAPDTLAEKDAQQSLSNTRLWLEHCKGRFTRTGPILSPRFIPSCSDQLMEGLAELQEQEGLPLQSHLSENPKECSWVGELCPASGSYTQAYARFGMIAPGRRTVMAHCVWCKPEEIQLLKESGTFVAHCPQSNANLASGIAPLRTYLREGLSVGLGSDIAGGAHSSIFRAMSDAIQFSKLRWRLTDDSLAPLTVAEAFYLGTRGGGAFFGKVGSFEEGYEMDALVIDDSDLTTPCVRSLEDRLSRIIYLSDERQILHKFVRGERLF